jgi:putative ABC transport system substrate-binding protein
LLLLSGSAVLLGAGSGNAQTGRPVARVGFLATNSAGNPHQIAAFRSGMLESQWFEGRHYAILLRDAVGEADRLGSLAKDLIREQPDVIVAGPTLATLAAMQATRTIPIVFPVAADPVGSGLVASLARPGGNVSGLSLLASELVGKCIEFIRMSVPGLKRMAILTQPGGHSRKVDEDMLAQAAEAAQALNIEIKLFAVRRPEDIDSAFAGMQEGSIEALLVLPYALFFQQRRLIVQRARELRLPAVYPWREFADSGGLMSFGANTADLYRRASSYVLRILQGENPAELPVEQPTRFELVLNSRTASALGVSFPETIRILADEVIE